MSTHNTYRWSQSSNALKKDKDGKYDADGDEITTYRRNSKGKLVLAINGEFDVNGTQVKRYKYCKAENYYRRDVRGTHTADQIDKPRQEVKQVPKKSALTAGLEKQKKDAELNQRRDRLAGAALGRQRGESSRTSTGGGSGEQHRTSSRDRTRERPRGGRLTDEQIARQNREDVEATALYHENGPVRQRQPDWLPVGSQDSDKPPSYGKHTSDYIDRPLANENAGPANQYAPPYQENPLSFAGTTGLTPKLGKRVSKPGDVPTSFGGRYDPNAPNSYSSGEFKGRRGNHLTSSEEENPSQYASDSDTNVFKMSDFEEKLPSKGKTKSTSLSKPRASSRNRSSTKAPELKTPKKASAEETPDRRQHRTSKSGHHSSRKRETSTGREGKGKEPESKSSRDPTKSSSSRRRHEPSDSDLYD